MLRDESHRRAAIFFATRTALTTTMILTDTALINPSLVTGCHQQARRLRDSKNIRDGTGQEIDHPVRLSSSFAPFRCPVKSEVYYLIDNMNTECCSRLFLTQRQQFSLAVQTVK